VHEDVTGNQVPETDAWGVAAGWPPDDGPFGGGGGHGDLLENREAAAQTRAEHTTASRQSTSRPAARFPASACRELSSIRAASTARSGPLPGAESKVVAVRRVPAVRVDLWTGRWWVAGASCCGCPVSMSAPASAAVASRLASAVPQAHGQGRVDACTGEVSRRDVLGASFTRVTPSQPDESWLPRPPAAWRPEGLPVGAC
jgi:hypothetical protein